jgi:hypothetical protein
MGVHILVQLFRAGRVVLYSSSHHRRQMQMRMESQTNPRKRQKLEEGNRHHKYISAISLPWPRSAALPNLGSEDLQSFTAILREK